MDQNLQNQIAEAINALDSSEAIAVLNMAKKDPTLGLDHNSFLQLQYVRMNSLSPYKMLEVMKQSVLIAYTIPDFILDERIKSYVQQMEDILESVKFVRDVAAVLQASEEVLGNKNLNISGVSMSPTVGNWFKDYLGIVTPDGEKSTFTELQYINTSSNVKTLSAEQKEILKNLIKLNDDCLDMVEDWNSIPTPKTEAEAFEEYDLYNFIPGLEDDLQAEKNPPVTKQPPVVTAPQPAPPQAAPTPTPAAPTPVVPTPEQRQTVEDISRSKRIPGNYNGSSQSQSDSISSADSAKIHDLINRNSAAALSKRGVTMDPTNIRIDEERKRIDEERVKKTDEIQKKLAELRKRNTNSK